MVLFIKSFQNGGNQMNLKKIGKEILYGLPLVAIILLCPLITVLWFFEGLLSILEGITEKGDEEGEK